MMHLQPMHCNGVCQGDWKTGWAGNGKALTPMALNIFLALADKERHGIGLEVRERTRGRCA